MTTANALVSTASRGKGTDQGNPEAWIKDPDGEAFDPRSAPQRRAIFCRHRHER
jgi:hypothetical protein